MAVEMYQLVKRGPSSLLAVQHATFKRALSILHCLSNPIDSAPRLFLHYLQGRATDGTSSRVLPHLFRSDLFLNYPRICR